MIVLNNGDKWIIDDSEYENMDYVEACKGNVPLTEIKDFVERLCEAHKYDNDHRELLTPRKLTDRAGCQYWDANHDVFKEVLGSIANSVRSNPWSAIYEMPWGDIIVVFIQPDCGGYDVEVAVKVYTDYWDYFNAVQIAHYHILK